MSRISLVVAGVIALAVTGCRDAAGPEREISGREVYVRHCSRCHGMDGKGIVATVTPPDLTTPAFQQANSDEKIKGVIMQGKPPQMPGFGGQFIEPTVSVLVAYIRELGRTPPPQSK